MQTMISTLNSNTQLSISGFLHRNTWMSNIKFRQSLWIHCYRFFPVVNINKMLCSFFIKIFMQMAFFSCIKLRKMVVTGICQQPIFVKFASDRHQILSPANQYSWKLPVTGVTFQSPIVSGKKLMLLSISLGIWGLQRLWMLVSSAPKKDF